MRKQITAIISAILACVSITACNNNSEVSDGGNQSAIGGDSSEESRVVVSDEASRDFQSEPAEMARVMYSGEIIPDVSIDQEGCMHYYQIPEHIHDCTIVFEEHSFGDYTVRLLGKNARKNSDKFPGRIFAWDVSVEVEKDEKIISSPNTLHYHGGPYAWGITDDEVYLLEDKVGSYLDVYDLEYPVIALKYYFGDEPERLVHNSVEFIPIRNDDCLYGLRGDYEAGLGVTHNDDLNNADFKQRFITNKENERCFSGVFGAERFEIADKNTLVDSAAGVKYTFDFSGLEPRYIAEKIK